MLHSPPVPKRPNHRLVLVVSATGETTAVVGALGSLGVAEAPSPLDRALATLAQATGNLEEVARPALALGSSVLGGPNSPRMPAPTTAPRPGPGHAPGQAAGLGQGHSHGTPGAHEAVRSALGELASAPPVTTCWASPIDGRELASWCQVVEGAGWEVLAVLAWQPPEHYAPAGDGAPAGAEALTRWELGNRRLLGALAGRAVAVVEVGEAGTGSSGGTGSRSSGGTGSRSSDDHSRGSAAGAVCEPPGVALPTASIEALASLVGIDDRSGRTQGTRRIAPAQQPAGAPPTPVHGDPTAVHGDPTAPSDAASPARLHVARSTRTEALPTAQIQGSEVLGAQRRLTETLRSLAGAHKALVVPELGAPSSWARALDEATLRARRSAQETAEAWRYAADRGADADVLWRALWQTSDQLASVVADALPPSSLAPYGLDATSDLHGYRAWIAEHETAPGPPGSAAASDPRLGTGPLISVIVPVYKPDLSLLEAAITSVRRQTYARWELCLCDDGSADPALSAALAAYRDGDPRVKVTALTANGGISAATNGALALASGTWVAFLDQDDELAPGALAAVATVVLDEPAADLVYSDDDKIDREGRRFGPQFKPEWSPDLLLSMCYFSHLVAMRRSLVDQVGGLRPAFDGGQDWDLALRVSEQARAICHIPQILYHWRAIPGSAALDSSSKPWAYEAARRALAAALERRGEPGTVEHHPQFRGLYYVRRQVVGQPLVSIVIPFRDGAGMLQRCVDSLVADPGHDALELVLVDNGSTEPEMAALLERLSGDDRVTVIDDDRPFNWAALNNAAIAACRGDMVLTLNNDVTARSRGWLREMVAHAQRPEIGAVGARLLYPDGRVQHVGAVVGLGGIVAHPMRGLPGDHPGYMGFATVARNWSAVTGACLLARRSVLEETGGFDEQLAVAFNDVDFCLRVVEAGYRIVTTPLAELVHAESSTRGFTGYGRDIVPFVRRWADWLRGEDPMFSPHLSRLDARCVVRLADEEAQWMSLQQKLAQWSPSSASE